MSKGAPDQHDTLIWLSEPTIDTNEILNTEKTLSLIPYKEYAEPLSGCRIPCQSHIYLRGMD